MLLRSISQHVKAQNWFAVAIDFAIVVVGVFIGIQVSNWNERLAFQEREESLMQELRAEIVQNLADVQAKGEAFLTGAASARRILDRVQRGDTMCEDDCWPVLVDLMHASQWQQIMANWPVYDELRSEGLPSDRRIIELVEKYKTYSHQASLVLSIPPEYRRLVRRLIPVRAQDAYWDTCYSLEDAIEVYHYPCATPEGFSIDPLKVDAILRNRELVASLQEWTSIARIVGITLSEPQKAVGDEILRRIDGAPLL